MIDFLCLILDQKILLARIIPRNQITLFLPRLKRFEKTNANIPEDDLRHHLRNALEIESEKRYPKASTTTSLALHVIMEKTELTTPKTIDAFFHKRYARLSSYYLSRSLKKKSVVSIFFRKFVGIPSYYSFVFDHF